MPKLDSYEDEEIEFKDYDDLHIQTIDHSKDDAESEMELAGHPVRFQLDDFKDDKIFKTQEVANICGLDPQVVRNRVAVWDPVLQLSRSSSNNAAIWTKENILKFQEMLLLYEEKHMTVQEVLEYYTAPPAESQNTEVADPAQIQRLFNEMAEKVTNSLSRQLDERMQQMNTRLLEMQKPEEIPPDPQIGEILNIVKAMQKRDEEREKELKALRDENQALKDAQMAEPPKKKLFGLFERK